MVLNAFRQFGATKAAKFLLFTLILSFAAWGIQGFIQAQHSPHGLTVNGEGISLVSLDADYKRRIQNIEQRARQPLTAEQRAALNLGPQLVAEAAARTVLRQTAAQLHLIPATRTLQNEIASLPPFLDERGAFDPARYRAALAQMGQTPTQFEAEMAQDLAVRNLAQLITLAPLPAPLAGAQVAAQKQPLTLEVATVKTPAYTEAPTEAELKNFYELNPKTYEIAEHRSGVVLSLTPAALSGTLSIPEAKIQEEYKANVAAYTLPEQRRVRHILVASLASATALQGQITTQADMATLANQFSKDPSNQGTKGGDLGLIKKADVVPTFADMAFALPVGKVSAPVQSPFGWHLIWVDEIVPAHTQPVAEVRAQIAEQLRAAETEEAAANLATQADDLIAGGATLSEVAKKLGLKLETIARTTATDETTPPAVLAALFATAPQQVSPPVNLEDGVAYVQPTRVEPATVPALADMKDTVTRDWRALQAELQATRQAEQVLSAARAPATGQRTLAQAAQQAQVPVELQTLTVGADANLPAWLKARLTEIAAMGVGQTLPQVLRADDGWHVVRMAARAPVATVSPTTAQVAAVHEELRADLEALMVNALQSQARIQCNAPGLQQVFGAEIPCPYGKN